jgi:hypothetical protein
MKTSILKLTAAVLFTVGMASCSKNSDEATPNDPATVSLTKASLHPEGVGYDKGRNRFLVSSLTEGAIYSVKDDGMLSWSY